MLIAGCTNSLLAKFQDKQCVANCTTDSEAPRELFNQPVFQTVQMFVAEALVVLMVMAERWYTRKQKLGRYQKLAASDPARELSDGNNDINGHPVKTETLTGRRMFLLTAPAVCDVCGTTLMNVGLLATPVSIFQMVRGAVILFVGAFSVLFLKRSLSRKQWLGLFIVTIGVFVVGLSASDSKFTENNNNNGSGNGAGYHPLFGVLLILFAQVFTATQFVLEEFILEKYSLMPIKMVMWEGIFGTTITVLASVLVLFVILLFTLQTTASNAINSSKFNLIVGLQQVFTSSTLLASSAAILISLATFNVAGVTVTRLISATSRSTIDACRTIGIWLASLALGWEEFCALQLGGFALLVYGTLLFNGVIYSDGSMEKSKAARRRQSEELRHEEEVTELMEVSK
jgi:drug/metabolite transporter (DMT)-like permease